MKNKVNVRKIVSVSLFVVGLIICFYPLISSIVERQHQKDAVATYQEAVDSIEEKDTDEYLETAKKYNNILFQSKGYVISEYSTGLLSEENYNEILNLSGNGVMGSIEIPKINVDLPIYHGVEDEVLSVGVGHLNGSSLPIGGENTRAVLTGHRGLPNSKLFTRLDEIQLGDLFYVRVLGDVLAYRVNLIEVLEPHEVDKVEIVEGEDLVSLVTCTPYGVNTHRLVVTGERVEYKKAEYESIESESMSVREIVFIIIPILFLGIGVTRVVVVLVKKRKSKGVKEEVADETDEADEEID